MKEYLRKPYFVSCAEVYDAFVVLFEVAQKLHFLQNCVKFVYVSENVNQTLCDCFFLALNRSRYHIWILTFQVLKLFKERPLLFYFFLFNISKRQIVNRQSLSYLTELVIAKRGISLVFLQFVANFGDAPDVILEVFDSFQLRFWGSITFCVNLP